MRTASISQPVALMLIAMRPRSAEEFGRVFFDRLELVPPGVTLVSEWRPDESDLRPKPGKVNSYGAVGRKPPRTG